MLNSSPRRLSSWAQAAVVQARSAHHGVNRLDAEDGVGNHCGRTGNACTITQPGPRDDEMSCGKRLAAVQQGVAYAAYETLVGMGDVPANHQHVGIQQADRRRQHIAECPTGSGDDPYRVRIALSYKINNVARGDGRRGRVAADREPSHGRWQSQPGIRARRSCYTFPQRRGSSHAQYRPRPSLTRAVAGRP